MRDSVRTAVGLGAVGALCGGCVSLLYVAFAAGAAALGVWFWGLVGGLPLVGLAAAAVWFRTRSRDEACEVPEADA